MKWANARIVISRELATYVADTYGLPTYTIPNGVTIPELVPAGETLAQFGLRTGRYILMVGRFVPEKRHQDLIEAFIQAGLGDWRLVVVGCPDHESQYAKTITTLAAKFPSVVLAGFQTGLPLAELYRAPDCLFCRLRMRGCPSSCSKP